MSTALEYWAVLSTADAAAIWDIDTSTIRHAIATGRLKPGQDCTKYGKQWVIAIDSMCRLYGPSPYVRWCKAGKPPPKRKQPQQIDGQIKLD